MSECYIQNLEEQIEGLARLVTNSQEFDRRFDTAVAEFKVFLDDAEKNHIPQELAKTLRNKNLSDYGNQQSYVDSLRREYKSYCKTMEKFHGARDTLKKTLDKTPLKMTTQDSLKMKNYSFKVHR